MKLFKNITILTSFKNYIFLLTLFFYGYNLNLIGSENKPEFFYSKHNNNQFDEIFSKNSIPFSEYDNLGNQFKTFFGFYSYESESSFYPDLSINYTSDSLREIYSSKLNNMAINEIDYKIDR